MDINDLENIIRILKLNDVSEFELNHGETHIKLSRNIAPAGGQVFVSHEVRPAVTPANNGLNGHSSEAHGPAAPEIPAHWVTVTSPIVGTFYRKPSPDAEVFVKEGDTVKKGQTLCIVEAMKLMNEISSTVEGKIEKVLLTDGQVVEFGEVLFLINPSA